MRSNTTFEKTQKLQINLMFMQVFKFFENKI